MLSFINMLGALFTLPAHTSRLPPIPIAILGFSASLCLFMNISCLPAPKPTNKISALLLFISSIILSSSASVKYPL
ncbi:MAG: hypothetical protein ILNGONEN_01203 [Syntrophorhabdaceae bacterium]|nr:hypothetical protein [Syntrophorhabdaceae bacterium]